MKLGSMHHLHMALGGLLFIASASAADGDGYYNTYCSSENTGADYHPQYNTYNSMGSCYTNCKGGDYAFAILQWKDCWCSNYIPAEKVSVSQCDQACPGYGTDQCGNQPAGLFGYIALSRAPIGTAGASPSPSPTKTTPKPTPTPAPTPSSQPAAPVSSSPTSSYETSTSSVGSSSAATSTKVIISGPATTHTVTTTPTIVSPGSASDKPTREQKKGLSPGATAGVVIGALVGAAALLLGAFLLWRRRRSGDDESGSSTRSHRSPKRKGSVLSRTNLLGGARPQSMTETNYDDPFSDSATHSNSVRHSMMFGAGAVPDAVQTTGPPAPGSRDGDRSERRSSRPLVYDQRLNPSALFANFDNGSRVSMQDGADYSRPLGVANPDFRYSFDSR